MNSDISNLLQEKISGAYESGSSFRIVGGNSKSFYGRDVDAEVLCVSDHSGILNYEPTELVITVRAGTPLALIEKTLDENNQMLAFEPPSFSPNATIGGTIACNFSGPRRIHSGATRDSLLGCRIINGKGEILSFGGEVMKNVAGYDVSRLMAGAMGTLGVILDVSLKVLPKPNMELTCVLACDEAEALQNMHKWGQQPLPISASAFCDNKLYIRISGAEKAVVAAKSIIGGDDYSDAEVFWFNLKEHQLEFYQSTRPLWRLSIQSNFPLEIQDSEQIMEWGGALRWISSKLPSEVMQEAAAKANGHATLFRSHEKKTEVFQPLSSGLQKIHKNLKNAFDPKAVLNPGIMYSDF